MKLSALCLLAVAMLVGACGCADVLTVDTPSTAEVEGTYTFTKLTTTPAGGDATSYSSPDISGSLTLTDASSYSFTLTYPGDDPASGSGTFTVDDPDITFTDAGGLATSSGLISSDGTTVTITQTGGDGETNVLEFTKS